MRKILPGLYTRQTVYAEHPEAACNLTAAVMVLDASGHPPSEIKGLTEGVAGISHLQPVDFLTALGDSPRAYEEMLTRCPWFFGGEDKGFPRVVRGGVTYYPTIRPPEAALMIDWIIERAYGRSLTMYSETITMERIIREIDAGRAVLLRTLLAGTGHYVAGVGYEAVSDVGNKVGALTGVIIRDPLGNYHTKGPDGNEVLVPMADVSGKFKPPGLAAKSGHLVVA